MKYIKTVVLSSFLVISSGFFAGCEDGDNPPSVDTEKDSTLLIYAVATNSLSGNLVADKNEMLAAAPKVNLKKNNVLIFETQYSTDENGKRIGKVNLIQLVKDSATDSYVWEVVKDYTDGTPSLDPYRMSEVIDYVTQAYPSKTYSLVLWSHSTGSQPSEINNMVGSNIISDSDNMISLPESGWFGQDLSISDDSYKYMDIDVLAEILPDHLFDYIWFDSCYMSNIESIYQLRNKCETYVAYPTEVLDSGLPYHLVLPYMVGESKDLIEAAKTFFEYYSSSFGTIAVVDMNKVGVLADYSKTVFNQGTTVSPSSLVKFSRYTTGPFYDFGDYVKAMASADGSTLTDEEWNGILDQCVIYKATTDGSLLRLNIIPETFSGISTHLYTFEAEDTETESYYKSLDWYKAVF